MCRAHLHGRLAPVSTRAVGRLRPLHPSRGSGYQPVSHQLSADLAAKCSNREAVVSVDHLKTLRVNGNCLLTQSVEGDRTNTPDLLNVELI